MTLPPLIRIFFAIDLPLATKEKLGRFIGALKKRSKSNAIRWTRAENLHITLHFLAEAHAERLPHLLQRVRTRIQEKNSGTLIRFGTLHLFPNPYRPRVIVLDILSQNHLNQLAEEIGMAIQESEYPIDQRPFRAHLTLGRIKQPKGVNLSFLSEFDTPDIESISVDEVVLFRSEPQPDGSKYTPLDRISLLHSNHAPGGVKSA